MIVRKRFAKRDEIPVIDEGKFNWNERPVKDSGGIDDTLSPRVGIVNNRRGINQSPIRVFIALLNGTAGAWRRVASVLRFDTGNQAAKERERESEKRRDTKGRRGKGTEE